MSGRHTSGSWHRATATSRPAGSSASTGAPARSGAAVADRAKARQEPWHQASGHGPPPAPSISPGPQERGRIADTLHEKLSVRAITAELGRAPSTPSRETRRNRSYYATSTTYRYGPHTAQAHAEERGKRPKPRKLDTHHRQRGDIRKRLHQHWSPEQTVHLLRQDFPNATKTRATRPSTRPSPSKAAASRTASSPAHTGRLPRGSARPAPACAGPHRRGKARRCGAPSGHGGQRVGKPGRSSRVSRIRSARLGRLNRLGPAVSGRGSPSHLDALAGRTPFIR